jgi:hypothetical protein
VTLRPRNLCRVRDADKSKNAVRYNGAMLTKEYDPKTDRCHAARLAPNGSVLDTCEHNHGFDIHGAMSCALSTGRNGAVEFKMKDGKRVRPLVRWRVFMVRNERHFQILDA